MSRVRIEVVPRENRAGVLFGVQVHAPKFKWVGGFFRKSRKVYSGEYHTTWARYDRDGFPYHASPVYSEFWGTRTEAQRLADQLSRTEIREWDETPGPGY